MLKGKILIVIRECNLNNQLRTKIILNIYIYYLTYIVVQNQNLILILIVGPIKIKIIHLSNFEVLVYLVLINLEQCFIT